MSRPAGGVACLFLVVLLTDMMCGEHNAKEGAAEEQFHAEAEEQVLAEAEEQVLAEAEEQILADTENVLSDHPLQLVRPDAVHHQRLEIVASNVKYLHHIDSAIAVVAVVGKYHSGKSFLLNQLMRKQRGFGIGPTVRPETMGIWMWGKPLNSQLPSGQPVSVIFIDTEGFAANNISETYDAKIFSVATLLSSYLIYNSVKIIDQAEIDYLELLARRTQLFALRSQISRSQWFDEFNHDLLKFPPLVWVVQDFVQQIESGGSPREWLLRIMDSKTRESAKHDINLRGIFDKIDCHTMFLPATSRALLQDLSMATEDDLTPEYRKERDSLLKLLKDGLSPKEKNGKPITGPEFATLLEILVTAANEGSLAEIPGRWEVFLNELRISSVEDCVTFYESDMKALHHKVQQGPINETQLKAWHATALAKAQTLLKQLLFGLESSLADSTTDLNNILSEKFEMTLELNDKKIQLKCSEIQQQIELKYEEKLRNLELPISSKKLSTILSDLTGQALREYSSDLHYLSENSAYTRHYGVLLDNMKQITDNAKMRNVATFEKLLNQAVDQAVEKFREASFNMNEMPRKTDALRNIMKAASSEAKKVYKSLTVAYKEESTYPVYEGYLETKIQKEKDECMKKNLKLVRASCEVAINDLIRQFQFNTGASKLVLPVNVTHLESRLTREKKYILEEFKARMGSYDDTTAFSDMRVILYDKLEVICAQRKDENYKAYIKEVETPLETAKKLILLSAERFDTEFSLWNYMIEVCMLNLNEGKAKGWQYNLKLKIAEKYLLNSVEMKKVLESKRGPWSTIKGFFQWIMYKVSDFIEVVQQIL